MPKYKKAPHSDKSRVRGKNILDLSYSEAHNFFIKHKIYCNFNLPPYILFDPIFKTMDFLLKNCLISINPNVYRFGLKIQVLIEGKKTQNSNRISISRQCIKIR